MELEEQLAQRCKTITESYAFYRGMFKCPYFFYQVASPSVLISESPLIVSITKSLSDRVIMNWCTMFGNDSEDGHWKKLVPEGEHNSFRGALKQIGDARESEFWKEIIGYRNSYLAHSSAETSWTYPNIDYCFRTSSLLYNWIYKNFDLSTTGTQFPHSMNILLEEKIEEAVRQLKIGIKFDYEAHRFI